MNYTQTPADKWKHLYENAPQAHLLQSDAWGSLKADFGWRPVPVCRENAGALLLFRKLPLGYTLAYIPKGPLGDLARILPDILAVCKQNRAIVLKIEPDCEADGQLESELCELGFIPSIQDIQPRRTLLVDIQPAEEQILAAMRQKTRYNIRLAQRKQIEVCTSDDIHTFSEIIRETGQRNQFGTHTEAYYQKAYDLFHPQGLCELLIASFEGHPLAGLMLFMRGERAWYFYGASSTRERKRMPTYLLQWEAMRLAKSRGCHSYDFWGVPDTDADTLEENFTRRSDGLWGVYRFKRGFGGRLVRSAGAWDLPLHPLYKLFTLAIQIRQRQQR